MLNFLRRLKAAKWNFFFPDHYVVPAVILHIKLLFKAFDLDIVKLVTTVHISFCASFLCSYDLFSPVIFCGTYST